MLCFFFSGRRRHTRLVSDWSSDVCSSDLSDERYRAWVYLGVTEGAATPIFLLNPGRETIIEEGETRSEERRVGKEGRSPGLRRHAPKKQVCQAGIKNSRRARRAGLGADVR